MEAYSYIPLDIKECENSNTNVNKAFIVQLQNSSLHSHTGNVGLVSPYDQGKSSPNLLL